MHDINPLVHRIYLDDVARDMKAAERRDAGTAPGRPLLTAILAFAAVALLGVVVFGNAAAAQAAGLV